MLKKVLNNKFALIKVAGVIILFGVLFVISTNAREKTEIPIEYDYNEEEQMLADAVKAYVSQYIVFPEKQLSAVADAAVKNYNIIISSDTDKVTDEITAAVQKRIRSIILPLAAEPEKIEIDTLDILATGTTEIIWNAVIDKLSLAGGSYENEELMSSLQEQINTLRAQKIKVSIDANIMDDVNNGDMPESLSLYESIENMSAEELAALAARLGISVDRLTELYESNGRLKDEISALRQEIAASTGRQGETGKTGDKGEKGDKGETGAAGVNGTDGKTTYIAYADSASGANFSLVPTETSKYVGTCITTAGTQPTDPRQYSNWQEYRSYVITSTTDPDTGETTVHIN